MYVYICVCNNIDVCVCILYTNEYTSYIVLFRSVFCSADDGKEEVENIYVYMIHIHINICKYQNVSVCIYIHYAYIYIYMYRHTTGDSVVPHCTRRQGGG